MLQAVAAGMRNRSVDRGLLAAATRSFLDGRGAQYTWRAFSMARLCPAAAGYSQPSFQCR
jgi:hypothetical protein